MDTFIDNRNTQKLLKYMLELQLCRWVGRWVVGWVGKCWVGGSVGWGWTCEWVDGLVWGFAGGWGCQWIGG